jgi:hypothetical protein
MTEEKWCGHERLSGEVGDACHLCEVARLGQRLPEVVRLPSSLSDCARYRLTGGELREDWAEAHARYLAREQAAGRQPECVPCCEISVWFGRDLLGSYGGTVWPSAWPDLFEAHTGSAQSGPYTVIKPLGRLLLSLAKEAS